MMSHAHNSVSTELTEEERDGGLNSTSTTTDQVYGDPVQLRRSSLLFWSHRQDTTFRLFPKRSTRSD